MDNYETGTPRRKLIEAKTELIKLIISGGEEETQIEGQHDAAEFLRQIFDKFENIKHLNNINKIIEVYRAYQIKRTYCKLSGEIVNDSISYTTQHLDMIPLSFNNKKVLKIRFL